MSGLQCMSYMNNLKKVVIRDMEFSRQAESNSPTIFCKNTVKVQT